ncbi:hypothetical protein G6F37_006969 [Rhizopus arrhizus]|nr:hypothetical protein G6F38_007339 [Rhizopus arrhizus]KAG1157141.1 hypothetical protein G6F37_006969 [Rhizopus arrhizus]
MSSTGTTSLFQTLTPQNGFNLNTQSPPQQQTQQQQQPPSLLNNTATTTNSQNLTGDQNQKSIPQVNVLHTVPVFFVNSQKEEKNKRPFEPEELQRSGSISLNYGDRRLSNILSDQNHDQVGPNTPKKKVLLEVADPSRGLFGDGNVYKRTKLDKGKKKDTTTEESVLKLSSTSIRVYGFPTHLTDDLKRHYEKYGNVVDCRRSLSDWITVTFDNHASALQALKTNSTEIRGYNVRIIPNPEPSTTIRQGVITLEESNNLLKQSQKPSELGQGKEGITAFDGHTNQNVEGMMRPVDNGFMAKLKETFFGW